uniref:ATP-binding cassette domain-containing protein n=1 Tax=uncultured Agitococcus sp. TaxID=1506599 RepID=UPI00260634AA
KLILAEEKPTDGKVLFEQEDIHGLSSHELTRFRKRIGVVFQDFRLLPHKTAYENIAFAMEALGKTDEEIASDVPHVLELVDLKHKIWSFPNELSGGEKARLLFCRMSFDAPHIMLLDEPTNHLDIEARQALIDALNGYDGAVIIVSHDPGMVERVADRLWLVHDGEVKNFDGDLADYRRFVIQQRRERRSKERAGRQKEEAAAATTATPPAPASAPAANINVSALRKRIEKAEKEIARLSVEKETLEAAMATPDFYLDNHKAITVQKEYERVAAALSEQEEIWLSAQVE